MFKVAEKTELNQISLTGIRALVLIGLLIIKPRSLEEIREAFIEYKIMDKSNSNDILRIDLNTIKLMGCEVSRSCAKTNYKYVLTKHPFALKFSEEEIIILKKIYNYIREKSDLNTLIAYHDMFSRIAKHICNDDTKEALLGLSVFRYFDIEYIKELMLDCKHNRVLELIYKKSTSKIVSKKQVVAQKLVCKNDKIYLYGYDLSKQDSIVLNLKNIESIISRTFASANIKNIQTEVKFILKNFKQNDLECNETVLENNSDSLLIKGSYHNEFLAMQRILSFGNKCTILEPLEFRNSVINKIKEMRKIYER